MWFIFGKEGVVQAMCCSSGQMLKCQSRIPLHPSSYLLRQGHWVKVNLSQLTSLSEQRPLTTINGRQED